jgi:hypothetical protein
VQNSKLEKQSRMSAKDLVIGVHLDNKNKDRVVLVDYEIADYVIDNRMRRVRANNNIRENNNFKLIYDLIVSDQIVTSIYKKIE